MAMILPFLFAAFIAFMGSTLLIPQSSGSVPVDQTLGATGKRAFVYTQALDFIALTRAALAYSENNPQQNNYYTENTLQPYMGGYSFPHSWSVQSNNGMLMAWTNSANSSAIGIIGSYTMKDCSYGFVEGGETLSQCGDLVIGPAPQGAVNGDLVWMIQYPH